MDGKNGMILWVLGGAGVLFLYSAYKAKSPQAVLLSHLTASGVTSGSTPDAVPVPGITNRVQPSSFTLVPGLSGATNVYDGQGLMVGSVPAPYGTGGTYIPSVTNGVINA